MSGTACSAHERVFRGCLVSETAGSAHGRVFQGGLVSETARSAHGRVFRGCLVSETAHFAHGRVFRVGLVSEKPRSAHGRVFRGCLVSGTACSAHGRLCQGCLVSEKPHSAHWEGLPSRSRERDSAFCSREALPLCFWATKSVCCHRRVPSSLCNSALHPRATKRCGSVAQACGLALSGDEKCQKRCPGV